MICIYSEYLLDKENDETESQFSNNNNLNIYEFHIIE